MPGVCIAQPLIGAWLKGITFSLLLKLGGGNIHMVLGESNFAQKFMRHWKTRVELQGLFGEALCNGQILAPQQHAGRKQVRGRGACRASSYRRVST